MIKETLKKFYDQGPSIVKPVANYTLENYNLLEVEHGLNDQGDYVWHFSNRHPARMFPQKLDAIVKIIKEKLSTVISDSTTVDVFFSPADWDKKIITVVARGVGKLWSFDEESMTKRLPEIGEEVSEFLNRIHPKRTRL